MEGLLQVTNDEYAVVKLTEDSACVLSGDLAVTMKMAREEENPVKAATEARRKRRRKGLAVGGSSSGSAGSGFAAELFEFTEAEVQLFEQLRQLRTEIARKEKVPPYIVFSDKTLTHMCVLKPTSKEEMLQVSGVGEHKYKKYGKKFLDCIKKGI